MVDAPAPVALVIEDEPSVRAFVAEVLREAGFRTCEAADAPEALAQLEGLSELSLIVSDVRMPGYVDGAMFANVAAQYQPQAAIVVIRATCRRSSAWNVVPREAVHLSRTAKCCRCRHSTSSASELIGLGRVRNSTEAASFKRSCSPLLCTGRWSREGAPAATPEHLVFPHSGVTVP